ncbi:MAG: histidine kinase [Candidatus Pseudobacter hemicellulosilyticus]|uniref:Histidine kinase n=1 Tax=Candidatus Pseudobacter hemicellulosilyticus TaxID=3121375 RepID=A0AAJ5WQ17_9BACT|nr:MAG: histidine kinase [Pseudobacter sp.]
MANNLLPKKWKEILVHCTGWAAVFGLPFLVWLYDDRFRDNPMGIRFIYMNSLTTVIWMIIFYLNAFFLTQRFLYPKKYWQLGGIYLILFFTSMGGHYLLFDWLITDRPPRLLSGIAFNLPTFVLAIAASIAYRTIVDKTRNDRLLHEKQEENLKSELSFLRSQISPHFMFNVLNNMLAMARAGSEQLEPTIHKLSSLMRYTLYESDGDKVAIAKEVDYLYSYIELQRQRIGSKVKLEVKLQEPTADLEIAPMLLIPFIENAFKHGLGHRPQSEIYIDLYCSNNTLFFSTRNTFQPGSGEVKDKTSGIGLTNVKRRLNLLYPDKHNLLITREGHWFNVSLQINLL